ncbi:MAG: hypothetical protein R2724_07130 [Bryobacterales bacterium]
MGILVVDELEVDLVGIGLGAIDELLVADDVDLNDRVMPMTLT